MEIQVYKAANELYIQLSGRIVLDETDRLKKSVIPLLDSGVGHSFLDLSKVEFMDSAGLGVLVGMKMTVNKNKSRLTLLAPSKSVHDILFVSKLDSIFDILTGQEATSVRTRLAVTANLIQSVEHSSPAQAPSAPAKPAVLPAASATGRGAPMPPGAFAIGAAAPASSSAPAMQEPSAKGAAAGMEPYSGSAEVARRAIDQCFHEAVEFMRQGDYDRAAECYCKAVEMDPDYLPAHNNLAIVYEKKPAWHQKAIEQWERVLELSRRHGDQKHIERASKHLANLRNL